MGNVRIYDFDGGKRANQLALKADRALARLAGNGDREAFRSIVESNKQRMFTVARSVIEDAALAEDVVQEAFIKAYRALPEFKGQARLSTWLHRITYLTAIDMRRRRSRHLRLATEELVEDKLVDHSPANSGEGELESMQLQSHIAAALAQLSDFEQTVFTLRHIRNFKLREIAQVLNRSEGTIKNILFRAIRKMRDQLSDTQVSLRETNRC